MNPPTRQGPTSPIHLPIRNRRPYCSLARLVYELYPLPEEEIKIVEEPTRQQDRQILEHTMKVIYDKETDTLSIIRRPGAVAESDEPRPGTILDYDKAGRLVSIELLDASEQVHGPQSVEFALASGA